MFTVLSLFGGAAAFEVRKRAVLHSQRKEIRDLRDQQHHLDTVLESLKQQLQDASLENQSTSSALEDVQEAAAALGRLSQTLREENLRLSEKQETLISENNTLKEENTDLKTKLHSLQQDNEATMAELEHLRDEAKVAMEEFLEGEISKENLNNRLHALGVEVAFVDPVSHQSYSVNDDSWLLQMSSYSALDPEKTAKLLMLGSSLGNNNAGATPVPSGPLSSNPHPSSSAIRAEHSLQATQAMMLSKEASASQSSRTSLPAAKLQAGGGQENPAAAARPLKAAPGKDSRNAGVAFQIVDGNQAGAGRKQQQHHRSGEGRTGGSIAWKPNAVFQANDSFLPDTKVVIGGPNILSAPAADSLLEAASSSPPAFRTGSSSSALSLR